MTARIALRSLAARALTNRWSLPPIRRLLLGEAGTIFTLHRFAHARGDLTALKSRELEGALKTLVRIGCKFVSLESMIEQVSAGILPPNSVAFTVDDGYFDFIDIGLPIFEAYHCPVTAFLVTGFIDGQMWLWWDQVEFLLNSGKGRLALSTSVGDLDIDLSQDASGQKARDEILLLLKRVSNEEREDKIAELGAQLKVALPDKPPPKYRPLTWDQARDATLRGASFGPHSVTHPILPVVSQARAEHEIAGSWARMRQEIAGAVPILAYPNGDFTHREISLAQSTGLKAALTTAPGHLTSKNFQAGAYRLPRFDLRCSDVAICQIVSGIEAVKHRIRHRLQ